MAHVCTALIIKQKFWLINDFICKFDFLDGKNKKELAK